jgi:hypothetical protein
MAMSGTPSTAGTWRERWAYRENAGRTEAYANAMTVWQRRDDDLREMHDTVAFASGAPGDALPALSLRHDERIFLTVAGVWSVQAPGVDWLPPPALDAVPLGSPADRVSPGIGIGHGGTAVITNRRLIFVGPGRTDEWAYEKIVGLTHDPAAPMTLIRTRDRRMASGLLVRTEVVEGFRFHLQVAMADAAGDRGALVAHVAELIREHDHRRPRQPLAVEPIDAPLRARWSPVVVLAGTLVVLALLCGVGAIIANAGTTPVPAPALAGPASPVSPSARPDPPSPAAADRTIAPKAAPRLRTASPTPTTPAADPLCGAPPNPLAYTFCAGGSLITDPDAATCDYFDCTGGFRDGRGYLVQCADGRVALSGGRPQSCAWHGGERRIVHER